MVIDQALLDSKLAELAKVRSWSPGLLEKLARAMHAPDDLALLRMNAFSFARENGASDEEVIDLFLHAAHAGIVAMDWHLLCPACGTAVESFASLRGVHRLFFCAMCMIQSEANLDDYIQVSFTVAPQIRRLRFHDTTSLSAADFLFGMRFNRASHA